jgi:hypothetical protein
VFGVLIMPSAPCQLQLDLPGGVVRKQPASGDRQVPDYGGRCRCRPEPTTGRSHEYERTPCARAQIRLRRLIHGRRAQTFSSWFLFGDDTTCRSRTLLVDSSPTERRSGGNVCAYRPSRAPLVSPFKAASSWAEAPGTSTAQSWSSRKSISLVLRQSDLGLRLHGVADHLRVSSVARLTGPCRLSCQNSRLVEAHGFGFRVVGLLSGLLRSRSRIARRNTPRLGSKGPLPWRGRPMVIGRPRSFPGPFLSP